MAEWCVALSLVTSLLYTYVVHVYLYTYTYIYICIYTQYIYIYIYMYISMYMHTYTYICLCIREDRYWHTTHAHTCARTHDARTRARTRTHTQGLDDASDMVACTGKGAEGEWSSGLCDCFKDCRKCIISMIPIVNIFDTAHTYNVMNGQVHAQAHRHRHTDAWMHIRTILRRCFNCLPCESAHDVSIVCSVTLHLTLIKIDLDQD